MTMDRAGWVPALPEIEVKACSRGNGDLYIRRTFLSAEQTSTTKGKKNERKRKDEARGLKKNEARPKAKQTETQAENKKKHRRN